MKKIILTIAAIAALSASSLSFSMNIGKAIEERDLQQVKNLVTEENINKYIIRSDKYQIRKETPLFIACGRVDCDLSIVKELLKNKNIDINKKAYLHVNPRNLSLRQIFTPLEGACEIGDPIIIKLLLENGAIVTEYALNITKSLRSNLPSDYLNLASDYDKAPNRTNFLEDIKYKKNMTYKNLEDAYDILLQRSTIIKPLETRFDTKPRKRGGLTVNKKRIEGPKLFEKPTTN